MTSILHPSRILSGAARVAGMREKQGGCQYCPDRDNERVERSKVSIDNELRWYCPGSGDPPWVIPTRGFVRPRSCRLVHVRVRALLARGTERPRRHLRPPGVE